MTEKFKKEINEKQLNENENKVNEIQTESKNNIDIYIQKEENSNENRKINQINKNK